MKEIIVVGAGASGLACCMRLLEMIDLYLLDIHITLIEANRTIGKKLNATGNGKCNLSHANIQASDYHTTNMRIVEKVLEDFSVEEFFDGHGLWTKQMGDLIYPSSEQARSVVNFFKKKLNHPSMTLVLDEKVTGIDEYVHTNKQRFHYDKLVLCCGSKAAGQLGGNDSGYELLRGLGHTITALKPGLVQLTSRDVPAYLKGTRLHGTFTLWHDSKRIHEEKGEVLFTDYGLSGIAMFQMSRYASSGDTITIDAFDSYTKEEFKDKVYSQYFQECLDLEGMLPGNYARYIRESVGRIDERSLSLLAGLCKQATFRIDGLYHYDHAQIVQGGLSMKEVNEDLSSKINNNIYICGELLDVDGPCGGYNLHFAFSSGYYAAGNIIKTLEREDSNV